MARSRLPGPAISAWHASAAPYVLCLPLPPYTVAQLWIAMFEACSQSQHIPQQVLPAVLTVIRVTSARTPVGAPLFNSETCPAPIARC